MPISLKKKPSLLTFIKALEKVESDNKPWAVGDLGAKGGRSIGPLQISIAYYIDAWDTSVGWEDCLGMKPNTTNSDLASIVNVLAVQKSRMTFMLWTHRYARIPIQLEDWQTIARRHNGGPTGDTVEDTKKYWQRVRKELGI